MKIEIVYANKDKQCIIPCEIDEGATIRDAMQVSGILKQFPEIDLTVNKVGIYSKKMRLQTQLKDGDRVEIYRPLVIDPKQARRNRARNSTT